MPFYLQIQEFEAEYSYVIWEMYIKKRIPSGFIEDSKKNSTTILCISKGWITSKDTNILSVNGNLYVQMRRNLVNIFNYPASGTEINVEIYANLVLLSITKCSYHIPIYIKYKVFRNIA